MNNEQKILNLLGIARRAGRLLSGEEMVIEAIRKQKPTLVIVASDASQNTLKRIKDKSTYYHVPCIELATRLQLSQAIGQQRSVIALTDVGFAKKIKQLLEN